MMKKQLSALLLSLLACSAWAESIDQEGRKWITASDLIPKSVTAKVITKESVKEYIKRLNTWEMCTYPELWNATKEQRRELLEKSSVSEDPEERWLFWSHYRGNNQLLEEFFIDEPNYETFLIGGSASDALEVAISQLSERERKATLVKDCAKWGK